MGIGSILRLLTKGNGKTVTKTVTETVTDAMPETIPEEPDTDEYTPNEEVPDDGSVPNNDSDGENESMVKEGLDLTKRTFFQHYATLNNEIHKGIYYYIGIFAADFLCGDAGLGR